MNRIQLNQDIQPLSEFRANVASYIKQVHKTNRPLVITTHGKGTAVLLNISEYETMLEMIERYELIEEIKQAEKEVSEGKFITSKVALKRALARLKR